MPGNKTKIMKGQAEQKTIGNTFWILFGIIAVAVLFAIVYVLYGQLLPVNLG